MYTDNLIHAQMMALLYNHSPDNKVTHGMMKQLIEERDALKEDIAYDNCLEENARLKAERLILRQAAGLEVTKDV